MGEDERLREALLELQILGDREARALEETQTLLACLEAYTSAPSPSAALASIFVSLENAIDASVSMVVRATPEGQLTIQASNEPELVGGELQAPIDIFSRSRNIMDLNLVGSWAGRLRYNAYSGLLVAPAADQTALLCFRKAPKGFGKESLKLVTRLSGLAGQALRNSEIASENNLLAATIAGSSSGFAIADATNDDLPLIYVNAAFEQLSGYKAEDALGQNCRFLTAEAPDAPERTRLREAVNRRAGGTFLLRNRRRTGELFWNELTLFPVYDSDGDVCHLVATQSDVSERVDAANERDQARARMERALAATDDAFLVVEPDGQISFANDAINDLLSVPGLSWTKGSRFSDNWAAYLESVPFPPFHMSGDLDEAYFSELATLQQPQEVELPNGRNILLRVAGLDDGGLVISATDITPMKSAQRLLAQRLAAIEAASDGIAITNDDGRLTYLNSAASRLLGFGRQEDGLGRRWYRQYTEATPVPSDKPFETTLLRTEESQTVTHEITGSPLENGGSVIVVRDITESLETEAREEELMQDLIRLQRQEAIAQLTAGVAHDFNNLLSAINGSAALIGMLEDLPDAVQPHLDRITSAGSQSAKLLNRLLDIGSGSEVDGAFDLSSILADLSQIMQPSLPAGITFDVIAPKSGVALRGNAGALSQVLINLCMNARDAIQTDHGEIKLNVSLVKGADVLSTTVGHLNEAGRYISLTVSDTGAGMDAETSASMFQPYFSTKGRMGTGLGLAIVAMHTKSVGGAIKVASKPGEGTEVSIYWPMASLGTNSDGVLEAKTSDLSDMTVIVVDDDPNVGHVISKYLEAVGAEVATCEDPRDALDAIVDDPESWSALITDYDMPHMNGGELSARARQIAPDLPVIVVTALARRLTDPRLTEGQVAAILSKPVDLDQLCSTLEQHRK